MVTKVRRCDRGSHPYCALELVVADRRYTTARAFLLAERNLLHARGWGGASPPNGNELADESPGHRLRIVFATAYGDLRNIDLASTQRARKVTLALSAQLFTGVPALSVVLQADSQ